MAGTGSIPPADPPISLDTLSFPWSHVAPATGVGPVVAPTASPGAQVDAGPPPAAGSAVPGAVDPATAATSAIPAQPADVADATTGGLIAPSVLPVGDVPAVPDVTGSAGPTPAAAPAATKTPPTPLAAIAAGLGLGSIPAAAPSPIANAGSLGPGVPTEAPAVGPDVLPAGGAPVGPPDATGALPAGSPPPTPVPFGAAPSDTGSGPGAPSADAGASSAPPPFGPAPATLSQILAAPNPGAVSDIVGGSSIENPDQAAAAARATADPFDPAVDPETRQRVLNDLALHDPAGFAAAVAAHDEGRAQAQVAAQLKIANDDYAQQVANFATYQKATQATQAKLDTVIQRAQAIADEKIDPSGGVHGFKRVLGVINSIIGGLVQGRTGSARNAGLDALNQQIKEGIDAQTADLTRRSEANGLQRSALERELGHSKDLFQAQETVRLAALKHADEILAIQQQNYDPAGTTAIRIAQTRAGVQAQQQQVLNGFQQKTFDNQIKLQNAAREQQLADETGRHNRAEELVSALKIKPGTAEGVGGESAGPLVGAAGQYKVWTGIVNPFDRTQGVFGIRPIGGKGKEKEFEEVNGSLQSYAQVQDNWATMRDLGRKIAYHKSLPEWVSGKFAGTDAQEYDQIKHELVVNLTKSLGDKLTQGQIDEQSKRIPDRKTFLESVDTDKLIADAQTDSDREFSRQLTQRGINPDGVIASAQARRALPTSSPQQDLDAANAALADNPTSADAKEAQQLAQRRVVDEETATHTRQGQIDQVRTLPAPPPALPAFDAAAQTAQHAGLRTAPVADTKRQLQAIESAVTQANRARDHYAKLRAAFAAADTAEYLRGVKPERAKDAAVEHERKLGNLAKQIVDANTTLTTAHAAAVKLLNAHTIAVENEPVVPSPNPNPLAPDPAAPPPLESGGIAPLVAPPFHEQLGADPGAAFGIPPAPGSAPPGGLPPGFTPLTPGSALPIPPAPRRTAKGRGGSGRA